MGGNPVEFHPEALAEVEAAVAWYAERSPSAAVAFITELERAVEAISESPDRWPIFHEGCRRFLLRRFPYFLVYREQAGFIEIVAVAHGRRRPGYWRPRTSP